MESPLKHVTRIRRSILDKMNETDQGKQALECADMFNNSVKYNIQFSNMGLGRNGFTAYILGIVGGSCFWMMFLFPSYWQLCLAISLISFFHMMEFMMTCVGQPNSVSYESFLLSHSTEFDMALRACIVEYIIERYLFPDLKLHYFFTCISMVGFVLCFIGQIIRSLAMFTAGNSFNHLIADEKKSDHQLITYGIYKYFRHPSYFGWYLWAVGLQIGLMNPVCVVVYIIFIYKFFATRIPHEESKLVKFFGREYHEYCKQTPTRIPFIPGI